MIVRINHLEISIIIKPEELTSKIPILFLHGFTGSSADWEYFTKNLTDDYTPICIDLLGHGSSESPNDTKYYSFEPQIEILKQLLEKYTIKKLIILGYSMGGRLALSFAMKYPEMIIALILESTSFGFENSIEKNERVKSDELLAKQIMNSDIQAFIEYWLGLPLFNSQRKFPDSHLESIKQMKVKTCDRIGLANSLIGFGTGQMKNYFPKLPQFEKPTLLICGELDQKFTNIAEKAHSNLPNSELKIFKDCGHNVHLENPEEFLKLLSKFLLNIRD